MKALITGIAGFTGHYLAKTMSDRGISVVGLSQAGQSVPLVDTMYQGDIKDLSFLRSMMREVRPDYVVHLAAISHVLHDDVDEIYRTNIVGTRNLLQALSELDSAPRAVLVASSSNVYGNVHKGKLSEDLAVDPVNDYSVSKVATEHVARNFFNKLPIIVARPFNYTGVGQSDAFLIPKIVAHVRSNEPSIALGNLDVARDFSDVRTVVECYMRLLECPLACHRTVNVCSGKAYSLKDILEMICSIAGYQIDVQVNPQFIRSNEVTHLWGDPTLLHGLIGRVDETTFRDTLKWMIEAPVH